MHYRQVQVNQMDDRDTLKKDLKGLNANATSWFKVCFHHKKIYAFLRCLRA